MKLYRTSPRKNQVICNRMNGHGIHKIGNSYEGYLSLDTAEVNVVFNLSINEDDIDKLEKAIGYIKSRLAELN